MARWTKGKSGNPRGRPKRGAAIADLARQQIVKHQLVEILGRIGGRAGRVLRSGGGSAIARHSIVTLLRLRSAPRGDGRKRRKSGYRGAYAERNQIAITAATPSPTASDTASETLQRRLLRATLGKTVLGMDRLIVPALEGKPVAWFAPNYRLLSEVWRELQRMLELVIARTNQQERRLELYGGGVIEMWSLDSPDAGRGRAYAQ